MKSKKMKMLFIEILGVLLAIAYISPFYIILVNSFKSKREILTDTLNLPQNWLIENYVKAMEKMEFVKAMTNSMWITGVSLIILTFFSSLCAWALVRNKTKISQFVFMMFVASMLIPFQSIMLPLVEMYGVNKLNLVNTRTGIIFMYLGFGASMSVFLFHGFIKGIPQDLEAAAYMDGCNLMQVYRFIVFPLIKPISVTAAILNGIWIWNDFLLPSLVLQKLELRTIPLSTQYFFGTYSKDWHYAMAGLTLAIIPVVIFYLIAQKQIINGVMTGALK